MPAKVKSSKSEASKEMREGKSSQERSTAARELANEYKGKNHNLNTNKSH